jgi:arylsulfatase A-like enzyme
MLVRTAPTLMRIHLTRIATAALALLPLPAQQPAPPPNVVFLLADDLGWADVSPNNPQTFYPTPHIEGLAAGGLNLVQAYAACPVCSPTRASILTGKHPVRLDTTQWFGGPQPEQARARPRWNRPLLPAPYLDRLPLEELTLAEALRGRAYTTWFAGKWHLGPEGFWPGEQGFDFNIGGHAAGHPRRGYFAPFGFPTMDESPDGTYLTTRLTDEAVAFLDGRAGREGPFLLYLSYYQVHTPLQGRPDLVEVHERRRAALEPGRPIFGQEGSQRVREVQEHPVYAAMVEALDESVGRVLEALERNGLADDTLVVFFSDNGGLSTSEGHPTSNLPLRAGKGWLYEGGIREPCIIRWPGRIAAGTRSEVPVMSTDFMPTLCELAGVDLGGVRGLDGRSLVGLWTRGEAPERDALYWHYPHYSNQGGEPAGAIRVGDLKLIEDFASGRVELYDLGSDPGERRDLAGERPEAAAGLRSRLRAWREGIGARMPERAG